MKWRIFVGLIACLGAIAKIQFLADGGGLFVQASNCPFRRRHTLVFFFLPLSRETGFAPRLG